MARNRRSRKADPLPARDLDPVAALAILRAEIENQPQTPDAGFLTAKGWAEAWGLSESHAYLMLTQGVKKRAVEDRYFRVKVGKITRKVRHFRVKAIRRMNG